jgi:hypothetical protein
MGIMKPAFFGIGLSMLLALGACAAPFGEEAEQGSAESVKSAELSAEHDAAVDALRMRVQSEFESSTLSANDVVVIVDKMVGGPEKVAMNAHVRKRLADGKIVDLEDIDFAGKPASIASPYRADVAAIVVKTGSGEWSTLKNGVLGPDAVESYIEKFVTGESPIAFDGFVQEIMIAPGRSVRTKP